MSATVWHTIKDSHRQPDITEKCCRDLEPAGHMHIRMPTVRHCSGWGATQRCHSSPHTGQRSVRTRWHWVACYAKLELRLGCSKPCPEGVERTCCQMRFCNPPHITICHGFCHHLCFAVQSAGIEGSYGEAIPMVSRSRVGSFAYPKHHQKHAQPHWVTRGPGSNLGLTQC